MFKLWENKDIIPIKFLKLIKKNTILMVILRLQQLIVIS